MGRGCYIAKADIESAFWILPISPLDYHLLGSMIENQYFYDKCLPMGCSVSWKLFEEFSCAIQWILTNLFQVETMSHILDDFMFLSHSRATCQSYLDSFMSLASLVSIPVKHSCFSGNCGGIAGITTCDIRVSPAVVYDKLYNLNKQKSQGPDEVPPRVLWELSKELSVPLSIVFNKSLEDGIIPTDWKSANVVIFKKGTKSVPGNYRPVSLTCIICKILEFIIRDIVVEHMLDCNLYSKCQHGFRKHRSCITQLLEVMEDFTKFVDNKNDIDIIYLDFQKAFDQVPHRRLWHKLNYLGITGNIHK